MDPRNQGLLLAAIITLSLAVDAALRGGRTKRQFLFMLFSANVGAWQLTSFLSGVFPDSIWKQLSLLMAVALPQGGLRFFGAFRGQELRKDSRMARISAAIGVLTGGLALSPWYDTLLVKVIVMAQAAGLLYVATFHLHRRSRTAESRVEATRIGYLVFGGTVTITFSVLDFLPIIGISFPPIGTFLTLIFMYVLSQSLSRHRLLDIYELMGRLAVLLALGITLTALFMGLVYWSELSGQFFLNAVIAALVVLILFDPLRSRVEEKISDFFLRERWEFERQIAATRADLWHVFDIDQIGKILLVGLERTRRVTHASLFITSDAGKRYRRICSLGTEGPEQLEVASLRPLLDRLEQEGVITAEGLAREFERLQEKDDETAEKKNTMEVLVEAASLLEADIILPISTEEISLGLITLKDDRLGNEPYTVDDIQTLKPLAAQIGVAVRNSQYYAKMKERDRLASLGEMAAGLAHEIRNPLGSIKGAAQYLEESEEHKPVENPSEFLDVIVEETDRLNRVVSTFLDYARPYQGSPEPLQVNDVIRRTIQIEEASKNHGVSFLVELGDDLPSVRADAERLHQVFINLIRNGVQAMEKQGELRISTRLRRSRRKSETRVEVCFSDCGPGISQSAIEKIFIPFFTTKNEGTGLGLPICQRIVQDMGGSIEVRNNSTEEKGASFTVGLPVHKEDEVDTSITTTGPLPFRL